MGSACLRLPCQRLFTSLARTCSLADQIKRMNELDASKSGPLLNRVIVRLAEKVLPTVFALPHILIRRHPQNAVAFNDVEQQKLSAMFRIEAKPLTDLLETCGYIFEQAAYNGAPSDALNRELGTVGMRAEWIDAFCAVWERNGAELRHRLAERSVCAKRLESIDWAMQMQLGQQDLTRIKKTNAVSGVSCDSICFSSCWTFRCS